MKKFYTNDIPNERAVVGLHIFLEVHRRLLGGMFGKLPESITRDAFDQGGYCLDAPEVMPAGSVEWYELSEGEGCPMPTTCQRFQ